MTPGAPPFRGSRCCQLQPGRGRAPLSLPGRGRAGLGPCRRRRGGTGGSPLPPARRDLSPAAAPPLPPARPRAWGGWRCCSEAAPRRGEPGPRPPPGPPACPAAGAPHGPRPSPPLPRGCLSSASWRRRPGWAAAPRREGTGRGGCAGVSRGAQCALLCLQMPPKKGGDGVKSHPIIGRFGTSLKIGIVGLPNVG